MLIYSDSQLNIDTIRCFLLLYITGLLKSIATCLEILFLFFIFTQSASEYSASISRLQILRRAFFISPNSFLKRLKYIFYLIINLRYLLISFTTLLYFFTKSRSYQLSCLIQNTILGQEYTIVYIMLLIAFQYCVLSILSSSSRTSSSFLYLLDTRVSLGLTIKDDFIRSLSQGRIFSKYSSQSIKSSLIQRFRVIRILRILEISPKSLVLNCQQKL